MNTGLDTRESAGQTGRVFDLASPIIIVGAGRSGSTLLLRMLRSHPDLSIAGEMGFLFPRLWKTLWKQHLWYQTLVQKDAGRKQSQKNRRVSPEQLPAEERNRVHSQIAGLMAELVKASPTKRYWGFKEIWNGSSSFHHAWEPYDLVFPNATWVHIVRDPLDFLGSYISWMRCDLAPAHLEYVLQDWLSIVRHSHARAATGRLFEIRYEDLKQSPRDALHPLFARLGLEWSESCQTVLGTKTMDSNRDAITEKLLFSQLQPTSELVKVAARYDYHFEGRTSTYVQPAVEGRNGVAEPSTVQVSFGDRMRFSAVAVYLLLVFVLLFSFKLPVLLVRIIRKLGHKLFFRPAAVGLTATVPYGRTRTNLPPVDAQPINGAPEIGRAA